VRLQFAQKSSSTSRPQGGFFIGETMETITITVGDDKTITVTTGGDESENQQPGMQGGGMQEGQQPYECKSADECLKYVGMILKEEMGEGAQEEATEGPEDYGQMWQQEAQKRKPQPGLMA